MSSAVGEEPDGPLPRAEAEEYARRFEGPADARRILVVSLPARRREPMSAGEAVAALPGPASASAALMVERRSPVAGT